MLDESEVRTWLWLNHGCSIAGLYGDDGEMQCSQGHVEDYKRAPLFDILKRQFERGQRDLAAERESRQRGMQRMSGHDGWCRTQTHTAGSCNCHLKEIADLERDLAAAELVISRVEASDDKIEQAVASLFPEEFPVYEADAGGDGISRCVGDHVPESLVMMICQRFSTAQACIVALTEAGNALILQLNHWPMPTTISRAELDLREALDAAQGKP